MHSLLLVPSRIVFCCLLVSKQKTCFYREIVGRTKNGSIFESGKPSPMPPWICAQLESMAAGMTLTTGDSSCSFIVMFALRFFAIFVCLGDVRIMG